MHGGLIVLGLSKKQNCRPAVGFDAEKTYAQMQSIGDKMTPVIQTETEIFVLKPSRSSLHVSGNL